MRPRGVDNRWAENMPTCGPMPPAARPRRYLPDGRCGAIHHLRRRLGGLRPDPRDACRPALSSSCSSCRTSSPFTSCCPCILFHWVSGERSHSCVVPSRAHVGPFAPSVTSMLVPTLSRSLLQGCARWQRDTLSQMRAGKPCDLDGRRSSLCEACSQRALTLTCASVHGGLWSIRVHPRGGAPSR